MLKVGNWLPGVRGFAGSASEGLRGVSLCVRRVEGVGLQQAKVLPAIWVAPARSYRSDGGGNKTVGAFETKFSERR
jgi:hypothetical protein